MEINIKYDEKEPIGHIAFGIGKAVEKLIDYHAGELVEINKILEGRILSYGSNLKGDNLKEYIKHFKIQSIVNPT